MTTASMQYFEPNFLDEALVVLDRFGPRAKALAGGTRLVPSLREHSGDIIALVNLKRIASLASTSISDGRARIGALVTAAELAQSPVIASAVPLLAAAAASMGSRQVRQLATIGGNICSGDAASDLTVALLASNAACVLAASGHGERRLPLRDVLVPGGTIFAPGELLVAVEVPVTEARTDYQKMMTRRGFEMALVAIAVAIDRDRGRTGPTRIALAGAGPVCMRATNAEDVASTSAPAGSGREWAARIGAAAADRDAMPESDDRASTAYRRQLVAVLTARALVAALAGAK
ncbi:MAG TPA: FAD binding domain-containing protein [Candidatus Eremiobacteraceae bacterium]